jgi:hypothetical protein
MKLKVTFRVYDLPWTDPDTGKKERGDFISSFEELIEGNTSGDILEIASKRAEEHSKTNNTDTRVWEVPVQITPSGVRSF